MPLLTDLDLQIDIDQILRSQAADPAVVRERNPKLVEIAQRALDEGFPLIEPRITYRELKVQSVQHERLRLSGGGMLAGKLIARQLGFAQEVVVMVGTIGELLEKYASAVLPADPSFGLALDALGSVAIENLVVAACSCFGDQAKARDLQATIPLNPGMEGWPVDRGQEQIFSLIDPAEAGVHVTSSGMMIPQKSLSLVIGFGEEVGESGRICDYCGMRNHCRYQETYIG
ncbi:MAG: hypothetical protein ACM3PY_12125 [Omnitrophica WOR_2 bacterium]